MQEAKKITLGRPDRKQEENYHIKEAVCTAGDSKGT
jgi:hypothetical protein